MTHSLYDRSQPRLRELVFVHVDGNDGESFDVLLTRVPGMHEEIVREDRSYRAVRVQRNSVNEDGRAEFGWHAFVEAELMPPDEERPRQRRKRAAPIRRRKKSSRKE